MTVMLSKTVALLSLSEVERETVAFNNLEPDAAAEDIDPRSLRSLILTREMWADLGSPHTITMTIQPGDFLNSDGENPEKLWELEAPLVPGSMDIVSHPRRNGKGQG